MQLDQSDSVEIGPQAGPQFEFANCDADFVIFGGQAGGGKSYGLLLEGYRYPENAKYRGVIFRRTTTQIRAPGALWDQARDLYRGATESRETQLDFTFPSGARLKLAHLENEKHVDGWQGSAADYFGFDELTQFTARMFWYIGLSRARSVSGIRPYVRAGCNPDPASWVRELSDWWIGPDGYANPERDGVIRWFYRQNDEMFWYGSKAEARAAHPELSGRDVDPKSLTFINSKLSDNPALDLVDKSYRAGLEAMHHVDRERLLGGNWNIRLTAGEVFDRDNFNPISRIQLEAIEAEGGIVYIRGWDKAGTAGGTGARTAGVKVGRYKDTGRFVIVNPVARRLNPVDREKLIVQYANLDGHACSIWIEREGGSDGKASAQDTVVRLAGFLCHYESPTGAKLDRAKPLAVQVEAGNVDIVIDDPGAQDFLAEAMNFDGVSGIMDQIDAAALAFNKLNVGGEPGAILR